MATSESSEFVELSLLELHEEEQRMRTCIEAMTANLQTHLPCCLHWSVQLRQRYARLRAEHVRLLQHTEQRLVHCRTEIDRRVTALSPPPTELQLDNSLLVFASCIAAALYCAL